MGKITYVSFIDIDHAFNIAFAKGIILLTYSIVWSPIFLLSPVYSYMNKLWEIVFITMYKIIISNSQSRIIILLFVI